MRPRILKYGAVQKIILKNSHRPPNIEYVGNQWSGVSVLEHCKLIADPKIGFSWILQYSKRCSTSEF